MFVATCNTESLCAYIAGVQLAKGQGPDNTWADTRSRLAAIGKEVDRIESLLAQERGLISRSGLLEVVRGERWRDRETKKYMDDAGDALINWEKYWAELPLDRRRKVVRSALSIPAHRQRTPERISFEWLRDNL